ncbi:MAG: hypothetical protein HN742_42435 [Lentisphaerae bacterium]|nr:hypothetical protein [Lentisphaerota bacterium]MBT4818484.1 hypothetical protein [Lentisphaerota bacterium]MBT5605409.1 hypothetical protein [Lentisphaerota bacterium]MBT7062033.1 hypothetical protein [Lentisphaerota bacterium]MBT7848597.1 hypothetical protein [Lentisphaerota bacterium]
MASLQLRSVTAQRTDGTEYSVAYWDVDSGQTGPCVLVTAALHGNELQGCEAIRRFLPELRESLSCGRCLLVPMANPEAIRQHWPHIDFELGKSYSSDRMNNLNCTWPGNAEGTNAQRLSHALFEALVGESTHCIDLHTWNCFWAATALPRGDVQESMEFARASALRFIRAGQSPTPDAGELVLPTLLSSYFLGTGRPALAIEFSGQYQFSERQIAQGLRALRNCLRLLDMLPGEQEARNEPQVLLNEAEMVEIVAPVPGLFAAADHAPSDPIVKGAYLGHIFCLDDLSSTDLFAPCSGFLYQFGAAHPNTSEHTMMWTHPYSPAGEVIAKIARV